MRRLLPALVLALAVGGAAAWYWQSQLIGAAGRWYLARIAARESRDGSLAERRRVVARLNGYLLMPPPDDALVPELFELVTQLSSRMATGEVSVDWFAYIYTSYQRDMVQQRPDGTPRRSTEEVGAEVAHFTEFYSIRKRPDRRGVTVGDLMGSGDDVITLEEIEEAKRTGKVIDLRTRGAAN